MKLVFSCTLLLYTLVGTAQTIPCAQTLDSVKRYVEKNYVGFSDKVTPATQKAYLKHTKISFEMAKAAVSKADLYYIIDHWISFFRDSHLSIEIPADATQVEEIAVDVSTLSRLAHTNIQSVEGIYCTADSVYKVAVLKSKKGLRTYAAVILESKADTWKPGQVKFELVENGKQEYGGIWYNRRHSAYFSTISFAGKNGLEAEGWIKEGVKPEMSVTKPIFEEELRYTVFYKKINDTTGYLRIKDFDGGYAKDIDSVVKANLGSIRSMPRLIIDLRGNGGGSDHSMSFLKPIIYTNPVTGIGPDLLATPDNTAAWTYLISQYRGKLPNDYLDGLQKKVDQGKGKERAFISYAPDQIDTLPAVWSMPAKVAIVINRGCGSSTEEFLLYARQSKKVIMAGEHSHGVLDYSNVVPKDFYCPPFTLHYPTTRSRRIDVGQGIDNIGLQPNIRLDLSKPNWLEELLKKM